MDVCEPIDKTEGTEAAADDSETSQRPTRQSHMQSKVIPEGALSSRIFSYARVKLTLLTC